MYLGSVFCSWTTPTYVLESICGGLDTPEVIVWADIECSVKLFACADDVGGNNGVTVMFCDVLAERGGFIVGGVGGGHFSFPFCSVFS